MILIDEDELDAMRQITMGTIQIMNMMSDGEVFVDAKTKDKALEAQAIFQGIVQNIRIFDATTDQPTNN